jgi:serine/threonine protein kinase
MKQQMQWVAYVGRDRSCHLTQVLEARGLPEGHYDYEEPLFLPQDSIKVIVEDPADQTWRETLKSHLKAQYPHLVGYHLLKVPRDPYDDHKLYDEPYAILKANLEVKAGALPEIGNIIDKTFQVEKRLGGGAAGTAFEVRLVRAWGEFARGHIFKKEAASTAVARRVREATIGGSLNHVNLVRVHDTSEFWVGGTPRYLVMDLICGDVLDEHVNKNPVSSDRTRQILWGIGLGLDVLHSRSILHRDVKAANVMLDANGQPVLLDLGVVQPMTDDKLTASQAFLGTLQFAAPEWLFAEKCTEASDVYSLGTIGYQLLTGALIFNDIKLYTRQVDAVKNQDPPLDRDGWDAKKHYLGNLVKRMLSKQPSERPSLEEVLETLGNELRVETWVRLHSANFFRQLPEAFWEDGERQRALLGIILRAAPQADLLDILQRGDFVSILRYREVRHMINKEQWGPMIADYLEEPAAARVAWVKAKLAAILGDQTLELGQQVESRFVLVSRVCEAEKDAEVRKALQPLFDETEGDFSEMIKTLAQENPAD